MRKLYLSPLLCCLAVSIAMVSTAADDEPLAILLAGAADSPEARGAILGIAEANRMGRYFDIEFALEVDSASPPVESVSIVIVAGDRDRVRAALAPGRLVINSAAPENQLRDACPTGLFHTLPSEKMLDDAHDQWRKSGEEGDTPEVITWHPSLVKFAARDLNKRFRERFEEAMASRAWAGWAAARAIGEAVIRTGSRDATELGRYMRGEFALDGQKGIALTFRPNGQLRQPLYYLRGDEVVAEAPLAAAVADRDLDSLGRVDCDPDD